MRRIIEKLNLYYKFLVFINLYLKGDLSHYIKKKFFKLKNIKFKY